MAHQAAAWLLKPKDAINATGEFSHAVAKEGQEFETDVSIETAVTVTRRKLDLESPRAEVERARAAEAATAAKDDECDPIAEQEVEAEEETDGSQRVGQRALGWLKPQKPVIGTLIVSLEHASLTAETELRESEEERLRHELAARKMQRRCAETIARGKFHLGVGAYVLAAAAFEDVTQVFRSYVSSLPPTPFWKHATGSTQEQREKAERVAMAKLYSQARLLKMNKEQVEEFLEFFRSVTQPGLPSQTSPVKVLEQKQDSDLRTIGELTVYLSEDPGQESLNAYRDAVRGLAVLEETIVEGEKKAVEERNEVIETLKAGLVRINLRAKDQGKAAGSILAVEAQPAREVLRKLEDTTLVCLPRALSPPRGRHPRGLVVKGFPGEWRRCAVCTLANPCSEHSALQQRSHQLGELRSLLSSEDVRKTVAHAHSTAKNRMAQLEAIERAEQEAKRAEARRQAAEANRLKAEAADRATRTYYSVQVIKSSHLSTEAARESWTCTKRIANCGMLDPHCEMLIAPAGGLVSKHVQWTPTVRKTKSPSWGDSEYWIHNSKPGTDLWRRICCGGDTAQTVCKRLAFGADASKVWAAEDFFKPDWEPQYGVRTQPWYCPSAIRIVGTEAGGIPRKAVTLRIWDHNSGWRKKAHSDPPSDNSSWLARSFEKISDIACGAARLELPDAWETLLARQQAEEEAAEAELVRIEREEWLKNPYRTEERKRRPKWNRVEKDIERRAKFRGDIPLIFDCCRRFSD